MDDYFMVRRHVPAFGSWDSGDYLPFTECFESARQGELLHYTYHDQYENVLTGDNLCVTGDLYQNDVVTPTMILVPPNNNSKFVRTFAEDIKETKMNKQRKCEHRVHAHHRYNGQQPVAPTRVRFAKPVDEDLYKISPDQLHNNVKKKKGFGCCFVPSCFM